MRVPRKTREEAQGEPIKLSKQKMDPAHGIVDNKKIYSRRVTVHGVGELGKLRGRVGDAGGRGGTPRTVAVDAGEERADAVGVVGQWPQDF